MIRESELILTDRCLIVGDVVKRRVEDAISGTVIQTSTSVTLLQPKMWPKGGSSAVISVENKFGNYASNPRTLLKDIPTDDLIPASRWRPDQFIIYKDWVGRIETVYEDVYVRLSNGSVVVVDDPNELDTEVATEDLAVGDYVTTKKGNLRRGRWIYGVFDPAIEPAGYIAETRALRLEVDWLCSRFPAWSSAPSAEPSADVDEDMLESGEIHLYDRRRLPSKDATHHDGDLVHDRSGPSPENTTSLKRIDLDVCVGDAVRFRDIAGAAVKYDGTQRDGSGSLGVQLNRISRMDASGFDINVFQVVQTRTMATILWQDLTTTQMPSTNFIPYIDVGGDDDVWPGELIATTKNISPVDMVYKPENVGIAQSVNARDRMAKVKWFSSGSLMFTEDEEPVLLPTSITSDVSTTVDEVSLYDISTLPGLSRRLGDYIVVQTDPSMDPPPTAIYREAASLAYSTSSNDWFGEVIELGLDGLITVRLGASSNVRDVKVPWECTYLVYSSDFEDDEGEDDNWDMEDEDSMDDEDEDLDSSSSASELVQIKGEDGVWRDVDGMEDIEDWITDEENANDAEDHDSDDGDTLMPDATVRNVDEAPVGQSHARPSYLSFSYGSMFNAIGSGESTPAYVPESFLVLEGEPPQNHHYAGRVAHNSQPQLKRIQKEYKILQTSLPAGVYVRTWESALDLLRVLILGPVGTPYEFAPFVVDLHLDHTFPTLPPLAFFHSWTQGTGPVNPNLYEDGKICLSLLGTWPGDEKNETWSAKSTIMQVLVSLVGLVLVEEPFYSKSIPHRYFRRSTNTRIFSRRSRLRSQSRNTRIPHPLCNLHRAHLFQSSRLHNPRAHEPDSSFRKRNKRHLPCRRGSAVVERRDARCCWSRTKEYKQNDCGCRWWAGLGG